MKKRLLFLVSLILLLSSPGFSREIAGSRVGEPVQTVKARVLPISREKAFADEGVLFLNEPKEVYQFFTEKGLILYRDISGRSDHISDSTFLAMKDICANCEDEFCSMVNQLVSQFENTPYRTFLIRVGDVYWTVLT